MAKNDYFYLVYKILDYMYYCLKNGINIDKEYFSELSPLFSDIDEKYRFYIFENLVNDGYVKGIIPLRHFGECGTKITANASITPKGIEYLETNSIFNKIKTYLKDIKDITPFI